MNATEQELYSSKIRVENKDVFVDLRENAYGIYMKLSERNSGNRSTVIIPASGIPRLRQVLEEVSRLDLGAPRISNLRKNRVAHDPDVVNRSVYVSKLSWSTEEKELREHFNQIGEVKSVAILRKTRGNRSLSLGCGVVEFANPSDAQRAVVEMGESELHGRIITCREDRAVEDMDGGGDARGAGDGAPPMQMVGYGMPPVGPGGPLMMMGGGVPPPGAGAPRSSDIPDPTRVFVSQLAWETTAEDLRNFFSAVGVVMHAEVLMTKRGRSQGHGIVQFAEPHMAAAAIMQLNKQVLHNRPIAVREFYRTA